jgi:hypothetical protein
LNLNLFAGYDTSSQHRFLFTAPIIDHPPICDQVMDNADGFSAQSSNIRRFLINSQQY